MKKKKIILCLSIIAFTLIIIVILIPRHRKSHSTVHDRYGSLTMEGKSIVIPFITELRVGTWIAKYKNGQIGEELTWFFTKICTNSLKANAFLSEGIILPLG